MSTRPVITSPTETQKELQRLLAHGYHTILPHSIITKAAVPFDNLTVSGIASPKHNPCTQADSTYHQAMYMHWRAYAAIYHMMTKRGLTHEFAQYNAEPSLKLTPLATYKEFHDHFCTVRSLPDREGFLNVKWFDDKRHVTHSIFLLGVHRSPAECMIQRYQRTLHESSDTIDCIFFVLPGSDNISNPDIRHINAEGSQRCSLRYRSIKYLAAWSHCSKLAFPGKKLDGTAPGLADPTACYRKKRDNEPLSSVERVIQHFSPSLFEKGVQAKDVEQAKLNLQCRFETDAQNLEVGARTGGMYAQLKPSVNCGFTPSLFSVAPDQQNTLHAITSRGGAAKVAASKKVAE